MKKYILFLPLILGAALLIFTGCSKDGKPAAKSAAKTKVTFTGPEGMTMSHQGKQLSGLVRGIRQGNAIFKFEAPGYYPKWHKVSVKAGQKDFTENIKLEPLTGAIYITSAFAGNARQGHQAEIKVNGVPKGRTPVLLSELPLGSYQISCSMPGFADYTDTVKISPNALQVRKEIRMKSNTGVLYLRSKPEGATVSINGRVLGTTPFRERMSAGKILIELSCEKYCSLRKEIEITPDNESTAMFELEPEPASIRVESNPENAVIYLNGQKQGTTPQMINNLGPGSYTVKVSLDGFTPEERKIDLKPGSKEQMTFRLRSQYGKVKLYIRPVGVSVTLDSRFLGRTEADPERPSETKPIVVDKLMPGEHVVKIFHPRGIPANATFRFQIRSEEVTKCPVHEMWVANCILYYPGGDMQRGKLVRHEGDGFIFSPRRGISYKVRQSDVEKITMIDDDGK